MHKARHLLKFRKSCPLNVGPLSLSTTRGIPSNENIHAVQLRYYCLGAGDTYTLYFNPP